MSLTPHLFRLFVSSTFSDFIAEREALQQEVFPELEKYCALRGARFQAVDLRWGITEEAQREHDTMRICLEEVRRCQQLSPKPNFAVLLGDRYGWEPVPARIPQDHWKRLMKAATPADWGLIKDSYELDENAVPPVYCLPERAPDQTAAFQREANLLHALRRAARRSFRGSARLPYFASATHQEIALGALLRRDEKRKPLHPEQHVQVYVRHLSGLPQDESAKDFIDWDANTSQPVPGARDRLRGLEMTLRERLPGHVHDLHTAWSRHGRNGVVNKAYLKRFCESFLSHQKALIDAELDSLQQADERQQREQAHQDFGAERAWVFAGRKALLTRIARYTAPVLRNRGATSPKRSKPASPLVLLGGGGSGKSALLARAAQEAVHQAKGSGAIVLQRYIGGVPGTESLMTTLTALTADIASLYGQPEPPTPENAKALAEGFQAALGHATAGRPLILYLDALDQLDKADSAWMLEWLPEALPEHVRVVASLRTGTSVEQSARRRYPQSLIEVPVMGPSEGRAMLKAWLADKRAAWFNAGIAPSRGRRLTRQQEQAVLAAFSQTGSALWLKLAYEEAASWASWEAPRELPATVQGLIEDLIDHRLIRKENHPKVFTERALAYLTAGRFGLSENELGRALGTDQAVRYEFQATEKTQRKWEDEKLLPPIIWSRLYFDLQAYLGLAQVDGALLMRWFHREFAEVLKARYLGSEEDREAIHGALADTFHSLERELRPNEANDNALFKATAASGKQVSAALRRVMEQPWQLAQSHRREALQALLTDFGFCMGKCAVNAGADLIHDYLASGMSSGADSTQRAWLGLIRDKGHLLRRGDERWPAHKIFLQVAMEQADDGPVTLEAQNWLNQGLCEWVWVAQFNRPKKFRPSSALAVMEGHNSSVVGADLLPNCRLLSWSCDNTLRLWDGASGAPLAVLEGHTEEVRGAKVLPDGRLLSWSEDNTLRLWDGASGAPLAVLEGHTEGVNGAQVLPDGRVLTWSYDNTLRLWDGASGAPLAVLEGHTDAVWGAHVDYGRVLSWSKDGTLRVWDVNNGVALVRFVDELNLLEHGPGEGHMDEIAGALLMSEDRVLSWSMDATLRLWSGDGYGPPVRMKGHTERVTGAEVLSDGRLLSWSEDNTLRLWDGSSGAPLAVLEGHTEGVNGAQVLPDGRLLSWSEDNTLRLWDGASGAPLAVLEGHTEGVNGAQVLPDGRVLTWSADSTLRLWDSKTGEALVMFEGHTDAAFGALSLPDERLLSWSRDQTLRLWDVPQGKAPANLPIYQQHAGKVLGARVLDSNRIVSWSADRTLRSWDVSSGTALAVMRGHTSWVGGALVMGDGRVLSWSSDGTLRFWDGNDGAALAVVKAHADLIEGVIVLPDDRLLSWSWDHTLRLWNGRTGAPLVVLEGHTHWVTGARPLPDGRLLSWSWDLTLRLWDGQSGVALAVMEGHTGPVDDVLVLTDDRLLSWSNMLGFTDFTLRIWDGVTGKALAVMEGHTGSVWGSDVHEDGTVLSWSDDGSLRLWDGRSGVCLVVMRGHTGRVKGARFIDNGRVLSWGSDGTLRLWNRECGELLATCRQPWIESTPYPCPWEAHDHWSDAARYGELWVQEANRYIAIANRTAGWTARWHGDGAELFACLGASFIVGSGRHLQLLGLFPGHKKPSVTSGP